MKARVRHLGISRLHASMILQTKINCIKNNAVFHNLHPIPKMARVKIRLCITCGKFDIWEHLSHVV